MSVDETAVIDLEPLDGILSSFPDVTSIDLIPILQKTQNVYGYLPKAVLMELNQRTGIPANKMYGVATFYEQFYLVPHGKNMIKCCRGTACHVKEATGIAQAIEKALGIADGETTEDMQFSFETVACLGTCALAPVMMINEVYHGKMTPKGVEKIIEDVKSSQEGC